jgi:hypothetical protein
MKESLIRTGLFHLGVAIAFILIACQEAEAVTECFVRGELTWWETIERMESD